MADLSDVADALVALALGAIYPAYPSTAGGPSVPVKIYAGWPDAKTLNEDLTATPPAAHHVSVFNLPAGRDTTRYPDGFEEERPASNYYAAALLGNVITVTGAPQNPPKPQNVAVGINRKPYVYNATGAETPAQIATALAALINVDCAGTVAVGGAITVPAIYRVAFARVGGVGVAIREVGRQEKGFQVTIWTESDAARRVLGKLLTPVFAATTRLTLADGSIAHLTCRSYLDSDRSQRQGAYRRDLVYTVEYATTQSVAAPELVALQGEFQNPPGVAIAETLE